MKMATLRCPNCGASLKTAAAAVSDGDIVTCRHCESEIVPEREPSGESPPDAAPATDTPLSKRETAKRGIWLRVIIIAGTALLVGLDQWTKHWAQTYLQFHSPQDIIKDVFQFQYTRNPGVAFGLFKGYREIFVTATGIILLLVFIVLMSGRFGRYKLVTVSGILILAGGVGNMIDRLARGYVVDFLYFELINFPIFNLADICVVLGSGSLLFFFIFLYNEDADHASSRKARGAGHPEDADAREEENGDAKEDAPDGERADGQADAGPGAGADGGEAGPVPDGGDGGAARADSAVD